MSVNLGKSFRLIKIPGYLPEWYRFISKNRKINQISENRMLKMFKKISAGKIPNKLISIYIEIIDCLNNGSFPNVASREV
jgi:hypothetical protein